MQSVVMSGGGGGDGHGELGISKADLANSEKRLSKTDGYVSQAEWSKEYFGGRLLGQLLAIIKAVTLSTHRKHNAFPDVDSADENRTRSRCV